MSRKSTRRVSRPRPRREHGTARTRRRLVLYTDGVIEARAPGGALFDHERLVRVLGALGGLDASSIVRKIRDAALEFQEGTQRDDLAIFVLRAPDESPSVA